MKVIFKGVCVNRQVLLSLNLICVLSLLLASISEAQNRNSNEADLSQLVRNAKITRLVANSRNVVGIGTFDVHLLNNPVSGSYLFLCTGFMVSNAKLKELNQSLLVTSNSCDHVLPNPELSRYNISSNMVFYGRNRTTPASRDRILLLDHSDFAIDLTNDLMYSTFPSYIHSPDNIDTPDNLDDFMHSILPNNSDPAIYWDTPSRPIDIMDEEIEVGAGLTVVGYNNNLGPNAYDCIYLGASINAANFEKNSPTKHVIGGRLFCEALVGIGQNNSFFGLSGAPVLDKTFSKAVGLVSAYMVEDISAETSTGVVVTSKVSNGLIAFVSLIGSSVQVDDDGQTHLTLVDRKDGAFEFRTLNPVTGKHNFLSIPLEDNFIHGELIIRDDSGRVSEYSTFEGGYLKKLHTLDTNIYNVLDNENIYVVKSFEDLMLVPYNYLGPNQTIPGVLVDDVKEYDVIRVPLNETGTSNWDFATVDHELRRFWLNK